MRFRLVVYNTKSDNQYDAQDTFEYLGDAEAKVVLADLSKRKNAHVEQAEFYGEPFYAHVLVKNL